MKPPKFIDNKNHKMVDEIKEYAIKNSKISMISSTFTLFAFGLTAAGPAAAAYGWPNAVRLGAQSPVAALIHVIFFWHSLASAACKWTLVFRLMAYEI